MTLLRLAEGDITSTLIQATEIVGEMEPSHALVVFYKNTPDECRIRMAASKDLTVECANWRELYS